MSGASPEPLGRALQLALGTPPRGSVAVAESLTGGHLQTLIAATSGASAYFRGGLTAYTLEQKVRHLGVDRALAEPVDCVSPEVAAQMAAGACRLFGADFGLATTGYAEPAPARGVELPRAYWALAWAGPAAVASATRADEAGPRVVRHGYVEGPGLGRTAMQAHVAAVALAALIAWLRETPAS